MNQLDRIETKLNRLLALFGSQSLEDISHNEAAAAVFAGGGVQALKDHYKAEARRKGGKQ